VFVITKCCQIFDCSKNQPQFMLPDSEYICWTGDWWVFFPFALVVLGCFGGGVIILFAYIACNRKKALTSRVFNARFRFLFIRFRDERIYWEIVIIFRKLAISAAVIYFSGGSEMLIVLFSMLVIFIAFIAQTHNYPFRRGFHNVMEYCVLLSTEFLLFCALLFYVDEFPDEWNKPALGWLCIINVVGSTILIGFLMLLDFIQQWREDKEQTRRELEALKNRPLESQDPLYMFKEKRRQITTFVDYSEEKKEEMFTQQTGGNTEVEIKQETFVIDEPQKDSIPPPFQQQPILTFEEEKIVIKPIDEDVKEEIQPENQGELHQIEETPQHKVQEIEIQEQ